MKLQLKSTSHLPGWPYGTRDYLDPSFPDVAIWARAEVTVGDAMARILASAAWVSVRGQPIPRI